MTRERFNILLEEATGQTVAFARMMVSEVLASDVRYRLEGRRGELLDPVLKKEEFIERVWADGLVPPWIDLSVFAADQSFSYIGASLSDDRVEGEEECVYARRHLGPFGVKSPRLPVGWVSVEKSGRFSLSNQRIPANQPVQTTAMTPPASATRVAPLSDF